MFAKLTAVAVALFMAGAPVVTTACEALCALRVSDAGTTGEHHSCHHAASPANEPAISSVAHICGHSNDGPSAVAQSPLLLAAPAIVAVIFELAPPTVEVAPAGFAPGDSPPLTSSRSTQLRI
jgi:hypothetical protein